MSAVLNAVALPMPGPVWGLFPQRHVDAVSLADHLLALLPSSSALRERRRFLAALHALQRDGSGVGVGQQGVPALQEVAQLRMRLRCEGFAPELTALVLDRVAQACRRELGLTPHIEQHLAAWTMLRAGLAEMATGEGKTLAAAMAACAGAVAGMPVHVITANDYLVERDAARMAPLFRGFGLSVAAVVQSHTVDDRRRAYAADITYCTAKELAFDYLRDGLARAAGDDDLALRARSLRRGSGALLRGLCMGIVDEADSILVDEARIPLVISRALADAPTTDVLERALEVASTLDPSRHFDIDVATRRVELTAAGQSVLEQQAGGQCAAWRDPRRRAELVQLALQAQRVLCRDRDYLVQEGDIVLIDAMTGRPAVDRQWSLGLHQLVALKEGCRPQPASATVAQITYQSFFPRYHHLCGMSGTVSESRVELAALYGLRITPIRRHLTRRWVEYPRRVFMRRDDVWQAVVARVQEMRTLGRPVLIGCDSVADSEQLAVALAAKGLACQVLNARQDHLENQIITCAGHAGRVTVTTQMAGRGTDIALGPGVAERGGLHVICCQFSGVRRVHRQLLGRAARQGDPGSGERLLCQDSGLLAERLPRWMRRVVAWLGRGSAVLPTACGDGCSGLAQRLEEMCHRVALWRLREHSRAWRRRMDFAGPSE